MKKNILTVLRSYGLTVFVVLQINPALAQDRVVARGATSGELYLTSFWYGIYSPWGPPYYDTLRTAVYHITEHGKKLTIQYDVDYFADYNTEPGTVCQPSYVLADATPGVLYAKRVYEKNWYDHTQLWISFDYGKNWEFREENIGNKYYYSSNYDGLICRWGGGGVLKSSNYASSWELLHTQTPYFFSEAYFNECEFISIVDNVFFHSSDCFLSYDFFTVATEYACGQYGSLFPDAFRGGLPGEVFITSRCPNNSYKVSFSNDTAYSFHHVYVIESNAYQNSNMFGNAQLLFMSDREPGIFYILHLKDIPDTTPWGWHLELCIDYYRNYGDTLVATYCHNITKDFEESCEAVTNLISEKPNNNSVLLSWTEPESALQVEGYRIYRNHQLIASNFFTETFYLDENLQDGVYNYYVLVYYSTGCISKQYNLVTEIVENETCEMVTDLTSEKPAPHSILLIWTEPESALEVEGYSVYRNEQLMNIEHLILNNEYLDEGLPVGIYEYYVVAHYSTGCVSDSSNHVMETISLGVKELEELEGVSVWPNPTNGELRIRNYELGINNLEILKCENVEIFDVTGLKQSFNWLISKFPNFQIDISHLPAGIYFVKITTEKEIITKKVIKY